MSRNKWDSVFDSQSYVLDEPDIDAIVNKDFIKKLRNDLNMSQTMFARVLGVSKKLVEKWEQGTRSAKNGDSRLLYLLSIDHTLKDALVSLKMENKPTQYKVVKKEVEVEYSTSNIDVLSSFSSNSGYSFS